MATQNFLLIRSFLPASPCEYQIASGTEVVRCCIILDATQFSKLCYSILYRKFEMNTPHSIYKECVLKHRLRWFFYNINKKDNLSFILGKQGFLHMH
jgi:hypothetical protein